MLILLNASTIVLMLFEYSFHAIRQWLLFLLEYIIDFMNLGAY